MADEERAAKRNMYTSTIITLKPGAEEGALTIHEDGLRQYSPFFRAALDKKWQEDAAGQMALPDDSIDVVAAYVDWL